MEMVELSVFMSLAQIDTLTSRFAFHTHARQESRKGFVDRLPESAFRAEAGHATIDVSGGFEATKGHATGSHAVQPPRTLSFHCCALCRVVEFDGEHTDNELAS